MQESLSPDMLESVAERFRALGEPARLKILNVLLRGEHTVSELVDATDLNQTNVSKHLSVLRDRGFVDRRKDGLFAHYRVADPAVGELCDVMCRSVEARAEERLALLTRPT